jgi:predicted MFS family arabinose efflux permease
MRPNRLMTDGAPARPSVDPRVVVPALGITQILAWGSTFYLLAVLGQPIARETGWTYDRVIAGMSVALLVAGALSPTVGRAIGERGGRPVLAAGAVTLALGLLLLGLARNYAWYLAAWVVIGAGMAAGLYDAAFSTLGAIYREHARGAITAVTLLGGFASTVCWPLSAYLVEHFGWRAACFAYSALQIGAALPIHLLVLPAGARAAVGDSPRGPGSAARLASAEMLPFVVLAAVVTLAAAILAMMGAHLLALLQARGASLATAAALGMLIGPFAVAARFIETFAGRRYHPIWTMIASSVLVALGVLLLHGGLTSLGVGVALYAAGNGIGTIARGTLPLALFGPGRYPALMGRLAFCIMVAMALAPFVGAVAFRLGGPLAMLSLLTTVALANLLLVGALWPSSRALRTAK